MPIIKIIKATYGGKDVTKEINSSLKHNDSQLLVRANNNIAGDPKIGQVKYLELEVVIDEETIIKKIKEGSHLILPEPNKDRLGIFYSNNHNEKIYPAIRESLKSIKRASEGKADIYTCMWKPELENPFPELIAWTKTSSHLNQVLQILQLLYTVKLLKERSGKYKYVSFLEHDVLYPEGYFDYPDFEKGSIQTNMNYIGLCKNGWQKRNADPEPLSQMTMTFDDAIEHFSTLLPNALITNDGPPDNPNLTRLQWRCENSAVHINHGYHFTSHFNIYSKKNISESESYWGHCSNYLRLFKTKQEG